jgi:hypothetical protein
MKLTKIYSPFLGKWILGRIIDARCYPATEEELDELSADYARFESAALCAAKEIADLNYKITLLEAQLAKPQCPPLPTPSLHSGACAISARQQEDQKKSEPPVGFDQLPAEQLRRLDPYLSGPSSMFNMTAHEIIYVTNLLWKIVRPGVMMAAGTSTSEPTPKPSGSANSGQR